MPGQARHIMGVDVGGTKLLALTVTESGEVVGRHKAPTRTDSTTLGDQVAEVVRGALDDAGFALTDLAAVGLGVPGVVDTQSGRFVTAPNLEIDDHEVAKHLSDSLGVPVYIGNDVNLGTLAEFWLGAARGVQSVVGMFVGTGIGGGVILNGRLLTGPEDLAGEIGHLVLMVDGPECGCGNRGCFEALASRTAIERDIRAALDDGRESSLEPPDPDERIRSGALASALASGDEVVTEVMSRAAHYLAQGVLTIRHLVDPDLVVLGGGVVEACGEFLLPIIEQEVRADKLTGSKDTLRLAPAALGDDAVALGAAHLALTAVGAAEDPAPSEPPDDQMSLAETPAEAPSYPTIAGVEFGSVTIGDESFEHDIHIRADGRVRKRKKKRARRKHGTSHVVDAKEMAKLCKGGPGRVIIGQGFQSMVRLTDDAREYLDSLGAEWSALPTPEAVTTYNEAEGPKALFLHVTC